jgi:hypothetical protein
LHNQLFIHFNETINHSILACQVFSVKSMKFPRMENANPYPVHDNRPNAICGVRTPK